jgi:hypothetical protein
MPIGQEFLRELEAELAATRRLIERVPSSKGQWKPHPRSSALGHLAQLVCRMPKVMADIVKRRSRPRRRPRVQLRADRRPDARVRRARDGAPAHPRECSDDAFDGTWSVRAGEQVYDTAGRKDALRNTINHFVHHRGQLTVYFRLVEVPVPSLYGPTADER